MEQKQNGKKILLVAIDMDGTLLSNDKTLSEKNMNAIDLAIKKGVIIVPATGRPMTGLPKALLENNNILYAICSNGAAVMDLKDKKVIFHSYLKKETIIGVIELLRPLDIILDIFADGKIFTEYKNMKMLDKYLIPANMIQYIYDTRTCVDDILEFAKSVQLNIEKINIFFRNMDTRSQAEEMLKNISEIFVTSSLNNNLEVNSINANKGCGLKRLSEYLGINMDQVMAMGDSDNDMDMLKAAGLAIAMENGTEDVKNIADHVTLSNEHSGAAAAIEKYVLNN